ncbi:MAG: hypothetical protein E7361_04240 [Clostridiales bacterium]|nr:hypothetical protein [Clostridiales bacterium]
MENVTREIKQGFIKDVLSEEGYFINDDTFRCDNDNIIVARNCICDKQYEDGEEEIMSVEYRDYVMDTYAKAGQDYKLYEYCIEARSMIYFEKGFLTAKLHEAETDGEKTKISEYIKAMDLQLERVEKVVLEEEQLMEN